MQSFLTFRTLFDVERIIEDIIAYHNETSSQFFNTPAINTLYDYMSIKSEIEQLFF